MSTQTALNAPQAFGKMVGALYLTLVPLGFFGMYVTSTLIVPGDTATTIDKILASETLFRLGIVSALLTQIVNVFVVLGLYRLLSPVNKTMGVLMVIFLLLGVPIAMLNELNQVAVLALLHGTGNLTGLPAGQLQTMVPLFLELHEFGIQIAGFFWGLWLFPMGYLVYKSGFLPKLIGVLLIIGCFGYLIDSFAAFLLPGLGMKVAAFTFLGEVALPLWLVIKGINAQAWENMSFYLPDPDRGGKS